MVQGVAAQGVAAQGVAAQGVAAQGVAAQGVAAQGVVAPRAVVGTAVATRARAEVVVIEGRNGKSAGGKRAAAKSVAVSFATGLVVAVVVPLSLLQVPNAIAWAMPPLAAVGATGPHGAASLLRAAGLALPVLVAVAPVGALAARRFRAWPVLVAGLLAFGLADLLGETARTVALIGVDRALHGLGAGIAMPAALALAWQRPLRARRLLAGWWAAVMVTGLGMAVALIRVRVASGGWRAALQPYPWLTGVALGVTALYAVLAEGSVKFSPGSRQGFPAAERTQLALLAVPVIGLSALALGISYRVPEAALAAAMIETAVLAVLAVMVSRDSVTGGPLCFPVVCAVAGFSLAPAAGAVLSLRPLGRGAPAADGSGGPADASPGALAGHGQVLTAHAKDVWSVHTIAAVIEHGPAVLAGGSLRAVAALGGSWLPLTAAGGSALVGVAIALVVRSRGRAVVIAGLLLAAVGLAAAYAAGPLAGTKALALVCVPLAAGLAAALAAALGEATAAGALSGLTILLSGVLTGYLAAGAIQIRMVAAVTATAHSAVASGGAASGASGAVTPAVTGAAVRGALVRAASVWELSGALAAMVAILSVFLVRRACRGGAGSHDHR